MQGHGLFLKEFVGLIYIFHSTVSGFRQKGHGPPEPVLVHNQLATVI
ncbi:hypothetical protein MANES_05G029950v8 [Manihot esculenta]|uniref:Uncharacterized protein n=1 Tax=Manihot esculenta TaxID=3983 RepID=A0ACB7HMX7_MANES|nr:hypothetical protein MANES_05G029950v8 [Manihot esculenta]